MSVPRDDIDWGKLRAEHETENRSFRYLEKKYGVSKSAINKRALNEGWGCRNYSRIPEDGKMERLKAEYISGTETVCALAERYGVSPGVAYTRCTREKWGEQRRAYREEMTADFVNKKKQADFDMNTRLAKSTDRLMDKVEELLALEEPVAPNELKRLADTMLGLKQLSGVKDTEKDDTVITVVWKDDPWS